MKYRRGNIAAFFADPIASEQIIALIESLIDSRWRS